MSMSGLMPRSASRLALPTVVLLVSTRASSASSLRCPCSSLQTRRTVSCARRGSGWGRTGRSGGSGGSAVGVPLREVLAHVLVAVQAVVARPERLLHAPAARRHRLGCVPGHPGAAHGPGREVELVDAAHPVVLLAFAMRADQRLRRQAPVHVIQRLVQLLACVHIAGRRRDRGQPGQRPARRCRARAARGARSVRGHGQAVRHGFEPSFERGAAAVRHTLASSRAVSLWVTEGHSRVSHEGPRSLRLAVTAARQDASQTRLRASGATGRYSRPHQLARARSAPQRRPVDGALSVWRQIQLPATHSGRESSIVDPMRLADWPMAYIGDMVPLAL